MKGFAGTTYDEVPYMAASFSNTHPEVLAVTALLRGIDPPPLDGARVLELGCARGANLVPMASSLPNASFVGVDLSHRQIDEARESTRRSGAVTSSERTRSPSLASDPLCTSTMRPASLGRMK